jgi:tetratricopeptide (TPR) repeat protein
MANIPSYLEVRSPVADFHGREKELRLLRDAEFDSHSRLTVAFMGEGGIGKTQLALKLAAEVRPQYADGQVVVELRGTSATPKSTERVMEEVLRAVYGPSVRLPDDLYKGYHSLLAERKLLIVLDNAASDEQVIPLVPLANSGVIVTSRNRLSVPGVLVTDLDRLTTVEAEQLARQIAPAASSTAHLIVKACDNLPLAIRIAASALAMSLTNPTKYLEVFNANRLGGEGPVEAAVHASYILLSNDERRLWRRLAVFPESFNSGAAAKVGHCENLSSTEQLLDRLSKLSLVEFDASRERYWLHDSTRAVASRALAEDPEELEEAYLAHAQHYFEVLTAADDMYLQGGESLTTSLKVFDAERANVEFAHSWADSNEGVKAKSLIHKFADAGIYILSLRIRPRERVDWLTSSLQAARALGDRRGEANVLGNLGLANAEMGYVHEAIKFLDEQLTITRTIGDRRGESNALGNLGLAFADLGDRRKAIALYEQNLLIAREIGDRRGEGQTLGNLGNAYAALGDARRAIEFYEQCLVAARELGDRRSESSALGNLGNAYAALGDARRAIEFYEQYLSIAREIGDRRGEGIALGNLGNAFGALGDLRRAVEYLTQFLEIARQTDDRRGEGNALGSLGNAYASLGDVSRSVECYEQRLSIAREIGDRQGEGNALGNLGNAYADLGDARNAIEFYEQNLLIAREIGDRRGEGNALWNWALQLKKLGDQPAARDKALAALALLEAIESPHAEMVRTAIQQWDEVNA